MTDIEFQADDDGRLEIALSRPFGDGYLGVQGFNAGGECGVVITGLEPGEIVDLETEAFRFESTVSRQDCLDALRAAADELGHSPTFDEYDGLDRTPNAKTIARRFGGWNNAKQAAGLETYEYPYDGGSAPIDN